MLAATASRRVRKERRVAAVGSRWRSEAVRRKVCRGVEQDGELERTVKWKCWRSEYVKSVGCGGLLA